MGRGSPAQAPPMSSCKIDQWHTPRCSHDVASIVCGRQEPQSQKRAPESGVHTCMCLQVTIIPREKFPLGQTVVRVNEQRENTRQFTRRYLEEQIITVLAGQHPCSVFIHSFALD